jgi:5'-phosphate synthase pdxT subunit
VLATDPASGKIVAVRQGPLLATAFHPELSGDPRLHALFAGTVNGWPWPAAGVPQRSAGYGRPRHGLARRPVTRVRD